MNSSKSVTVRQATVADMESVSVLFDMYRQFYELPSDRKLALQYLTDRQQRRESVILIAEKNTADGVSSPRENTKANQAQLAGFCQLYPTFCSLEAAPVYTLYDLFVHPDARRLGVARALLQAAEAQAKHDGRVRMDLMTAKDNTSAQALYESLGWCRDDVYLTYNRAVQK